MRLAEVIARHAPDLMARPGVIGVGEGQRDGEPCLLVFVSAAAGPLSDLPDTIEGFAVVVEPTSPFEAQN